MKIFITGILGFLGSHVAEYGYERGDRVSGIDNYSRKAFNKRIEKELKGKAALSNVDILDFKRLRKAIPQDTDVIFHMAALPSHRLALNRPRDYAEADFMGTANVLEAVRLMKKPPLVVFASTNKVYGKQVAPWKEDMLPQPEGPYAVSKWAAEKLCEMYNKYYNVPVVILRYHHVIGKRSNPELALSVFVEQALKNKKLEVHGKGNGSFFESCAADYTHVNDAIRATFLAVDKYKSFDIFNIANKKLTTIESLALRVISKLKSRSEIAHVPMLPHETLIHHSDVSHAEEELGFVATTLIEKAINEYIEWRV